MWSREHSTARRQAEPDTAGRADGAPNCEIAAPRRLLRLAAAMAIAGAVGGCFQPLYAERSPTGGPGLRDALAAVEIDTIAAPAGTALARIAVEVQNELRFGITGGSGSAPATHQLKIKTDDRTRAQ